MLAPGSLAHKTRSSKACRDPCLRGSHWLCFPFSCKLFLYTDSPSALFFVGRVSTHRPVSGPLFSNFCPAKLQHWVQLAALSTQGIALDFFPEAWQVDDPLRQQEERCVHRLSSNPAMAAPSTFPAPQIHRLLWEALSQVPQGNFP